MKGIASIWLGIGLMHASASQADCAPNATPDQIEATKVKVLADPNVTDTETDEDYLKVTIRKPDGSIVLSYFTLPGHPAHPANAFTVIYEAEGKVQLYSKGFTAGDCRLFEIWMKSFETQHQRVREQFNSNDS